MTTNFVSYQIETNGIATLTLNRPELHNAFNDLMIKELLSVIEQADHDAKVRVLILNAEGKSFCAGADLNWMQDMVQYSEDENFADALQLAILLKKLNQLSKPTIAMIQGPAYGGGVGLIACCDIAIATPETNFCLSEVKLGLIPAVISPYVVAAMSERIARRYFLTAEIFSAAQALEFGLVHEISTKEHLPTVTSEIANKLLKNGPQALQECKKLIADVAQNILDDHLIEKTAQCIAHLRVSDEGQEGLNAFLQKRNPNWIK